MIRKYEKEDVPDGNDGSDSEGKAPAPVSSMVAMDLWPMEPLVGVHFNRGDVTSLDTAEAIIRHFCGRRAEVRPPFGQLSLLCFAR